MAPLFEHHVFQPSKMGNAMIGLCNPCMPTSVGLFSLPWHWTIGLPEIGRRSVVRSPKSTALFECPTLGVGDGVLQPNKERLKHRENESTLHEIAGLSDEEARRLLKQQPGHGSRRL